jgi:branched-chain amino acid transport system permease protein
MKALIIGAIATALSLAAFFPLLASPYVLAFLFNLLLNLSLMIGMNLLWGFAGYLPLGYTAFFGLGGYVTARLILLGWPISASLPLSLISILPIGALFAWVLFRLRGLYFSPASLGLLILLEESAD